ncbi:MAG TPA: CDGSH iron-sulfur domain-containing protein [Tenuifilaceae bacterium]|nr:CDGSH iron-sulfur domain-containing protein [Tenuifilaceae bacterium]HPE19207.1 CDGSH iron-sulfur domain-containing protein [Tenuifilaceae bacterium]HPJ46318.1 CDGSH iron-sulfur domain-containing protein [Tenuifilaceae bacterium]HPQ34706.1 CDGSH iron-sulfur domain-containing protein [Tenuifilaceae bacterium]HRX68931.1 CDGSH iron-sulfur domain-containing protein [Tenuifilaceae bacterium]
MNKGETTITIIKHGPVKVSGSFKLKGSDGDELTPTQPRDIYLCACGQSKNKPFCDGSHNKTTIQ